MSDSQIKTTEEVLQHHLQSFGEGDVDALMEDYTEESVVMTQDATLVGTDAIRPLFEELTTALLPPGSDFEMGRMEVRGEVAYVAWKAESETHKFLLGTDTLVVRDGKIATQTFAGHIEEKA